MSFVGWLIQCGASFLLKPRSSSPRRAPRHSEKKGSKLFPGNLRLRCKILHGVTSLHHFATPHTSLNTADATMRQCLFEILLNWPFRCCLQGRASSELRSRNVFKLRHGSSSTRPIHPFTSVESWDFGIEENNN